MFKHYLSVNLRRKDIIIPFLAVMARLLSSGTADLSFLILAAYATSGPKQIVQAFALTWLFTMFNPGIAPYPSYSSFFRYFILLSGLISLVSRGLFLKSLKGFTLLTFGLGVFFIIHSALFSSMPLISIAKSLNWTFSIVILLVAWSSLDNKNRVEMQHWIYMLLALTLIASVPFLAFTSIGFLRNSTGFQGVLNHPQAFGISAALLAAIVVGNFLRSKKFSLLLVLLLILSISFVFISESRTCGIALAFGSMISIPVTSIIEKQKFTNVAPILKARSFYLFLFVLSFAALIVHQPLVDMVISFISKSNRIEFSNIVDAFALSRSILYESMLNNISKFPVFGIGFGVPSIPDQLSIQVDPVFGLPIAASVEKGVVPLAILEEVGFPGFLFTGVWCCMLLKRAAINGIVAVNVSIVALLINLGESVLFSPGGMGMVILILLSCSSTKSDSCATSCPSQYLH